MLALDQFETFKRKAEERETQLKTDHAQKLLQFSQEVLQAKEDFQNRLNLLDSVRNQGDADRIAEIERLKEEHRKELADVLKQQSSLHDLEEERNKLEEKYKAQLQELNQKCDNLEHERTTLTEDFEFKLNKAQAFYEKELDALKDAQNKSDNEQLVALQEEKDRMRKDFAFQESQYKGRIEKLLSELSETEHNASKYKSDLEQLHNLMKEKDGNSSAVCEEVSTGT